MSLMTGLAPDQSFADAVLATVAYADMFDFPLRRPEIQRDLIGVAAPASRTLAMMETLLREGDLAADGPYLALPGRRGLADLRRGREARATRLWPVAQRFGHLIGRLPFVRLVAVTGSLAAGNPDDGADIDYLIVTAPGRLWSVRAAAVALVRLARRGGVDLCPNYLLSTDALALDHHDLFTAHELLQARPLLGAATYRRFLDGNVWAARRLPNRYRQCATLPLERIDGVRQSAWGERLLAGGLGARLERWEAGRKQRRLAGLGAGRFTADLCEGHFGQSRRRTLGAFEQHCRRLGIVPPGIVGDGADPSLPPPRTLEWPAAARARRIPQGAA
jgi:hypothetical protein